MFKLFGVGGTLGTISGRVKRAPEIRCRLNLEALTLAMVFQGVNCDVALFESFPFVTSA